MKIVTNWIPLVLLGGLAFSLGGISAATPPFKNFPDATDGVLFLGGKAGETEAAVLQALALFPSSAEFDIPARFASSLADDGRLDQYRAVVFCAQDSSQPPLSEADVAALVKVADSGGLVLFFGESLARLSPQRLGPLAPLLGAEKLGRGETGLPTEAALRLAPGLGAKVRPWMEGGYALHGLTTAEPVLGDRKSANATVNSVGRGTFAFIGKPITQARPDTGIDAYAQMVQQLILNAGVAKRPTKREAWLLEPLGEVRPVPPVPDAPLKQKLETRRVEKSLSGTPAVIVRDKVPVAAIIIARELTASARQAANQLQEAFRAMSGVEVPIVVEDTVQKTAGGFSPAGSSDKPWETVLLVGDSRFLDDLNSEKMPMEGFVHRAADGVVAIVGRDSRENGLPLYGTLYGALDFLENQFGVRWLWPGRAGTVYPSAATLTAGAREVRDAPLLSVRKLRNISTPGPAYHEPYLPEFWTREYLPETFEKFADSNLVGRIRRGLKLLGKSEETFFAYATPAMRWFATARAGMSQRVFGTHAYDDWYEKYHKEHPEWFALQADGTRVQSPVRPRLDKGNPEVIRAAAEQAVAKLKADPLLDAAPISPNDGSSNTWDMSEASRKLDPPNGPEVTMLFQRAGMKFAKPYVALSDRVVTFYNAIARQVQSLRPEARLGATAYSYYRTPPLHVTLDPSVVLFYTGLNYLNDSNLRRDRENWNGWAARANQMIIRPNAFHAGHGFPVVWVRKMDADVKRCYETGMIGADWDSVIHHWATVGLNYYVLGRLLWDPSRKVDEIVRDYCVAGFGPAANEMEAYFRDLERLTDRMAAEVGDATESALREEEEIDVNQFAREVIQRLAPDVYTPEEIRRLRAHFTAAREKAAGFPEVLERLRFLELGLDYASLQAELYRHARVDNPDPQKIGDLLVERQVFFSKLFEQDPLAINLPYIAWREEVLYKKFYPKPPEQNP
jgi:hypothetical protein